MRTLYLASAASMALTWAALGPLARVNRLMPTETATKTPISTMMPRTR